MTRVTQVLVSFRPTPHHGVYSNKPLLIAAAINPWQGRTNIESHKRDRIQADCIAQDTTLSQATFCHQVSIQCNQLRPAEDAKKIKRVHSYCKTLN